MDDGIVTIILIIAIIFFLSVKEAKPAEPIEPIEPADWETKVFLERIKPYNEIIEREARENTIDPALIKALIWQESSGRADVVVYEGKPSWYGGKPLYSYGLTGLTLPAAQDMAFFGEEKDLIKPEINVKYATLYLRHQIDRYNGDVSKGLVAYNAGFFTGNYTYANKIWKKMSLIKKSK